MKNRSIFSINYQWAFVMVMGLGLLLSIGCNNDDDEPTPSDSPIASFQFEVSPDNFLEVTFTNFSQNATSYVWDFGDGETSTEENPTYEYKEAGTYTIELTASNDAGESATREETINLTDPNQQLTLLAGTESKTWYLQREGIALGIGPAAGDNAWWQFGGLTPLAERPCILDDSYTFHTDGTFEFNSAGTIFIDSEGNGGWHPTEDCWEESDPNVWGDNANRSAFGDGGDYTYEFDDVNNMLTLNGEGVFIGLANKTNSGDNADPTTAAKNYEIINFTAGDVADTLQLAMPINGGADGYWNFNLVSYKDPADLPEIPTDVPVFGEDLPDISPTELSNGFTSESDFVLLDTIVPSGSTIVYGVDDPADPMGAKVGQFNRTSEQFQELKFQTSPVKNDINFENLSTVTLDVYLPSSNNYSGSLTKTVIIGLADQSATQQWWTDHYEFLTDGASLPVDEWVTLTFNLGENNSGAGEGTIYDRNDLDMIYINIGGGDHMEEGTFYVRNFKFE